jgi:DNA-binding response OmpR family regulator
MYEMSGKNRRATESGALQVAVGHILIVEDDPRMQKVLTRVFAREGFEVRTAGDGATALAMFEESEPVAMLLDLILPEVSGRDVCKQVKAASPDTPVIILSSISDVVDKVLLLEIGADDYVTKPFSPRELLARVQAAIRRIARRTKAESATLHKFGACVVDVARMRVTKEGQELPITALEFKLLQYFLENAEIVLSRETLLNKVWGYAAYPTTRTVDNQILKLRQKIEVDPTQPKHLLTIYGAGYRFIS